MPKEMRCSECGKKMRNRRYHFASELSRANDRRKPRGGWAYKYFCKNNQCLNYKKKFNFWELDDQGF